VAVYGSCVARDTIDLAARERTEVVAYVARQSLLSIGNDASAKFPADAAIDSDFQRRQMIGDFAGDAQSRLAEAADDVDVLLWDLADERHGVQVWLDGDVVTRSVDNLRVTAVREALRGSFRVNLGKEGHLAEWKTSAEGFRDFLSEAGLLEKTLVIAAPWARLSVDGSETPASMGLDAERANARFEPYYAWLEELGLRVLRLGEDEVRSDPEHRWGHAPFHYHQDVYERIAAEVLAAR
jgi:hypothetical protein